MGLLKDHLIAHYKLNDNLATDVILDSGGSSHHGVVKDPGGTATSAFHSVAGKTGLAQEFDGGDDYIEIADHADFVFTTAHSISVWVKRDSIGAGMGIITKGGNGEYVTFALTFNLNNTFNFFESRIGIAFLTQITSAVTIVDTDWHHIVGTSDFSTAYLYLDGILVGTDLAPATSLWDNGTNVVIGAEIKPSTDAVARYFSGLIDNVILFNKALTLNEVRALYNGGAGRETMPSGIENQLSRTGQHFSSMQEM